MDRAASKLGPLSRSRRDSAPGPAQPPQAKRRLPLLLLLLLLLLPRSHGINFFHPGCGKRRLKEKDPRSKSTWEGKWPWQVSIQYKKQHLCEGTLIDVRWVLTASHCLHRTNDPTVYHAVLGIHKLYEKSPNSLRVGVKMIFSYPNMAKIQPFGQDIAMLLLELPVRLSPYVMPVCMPRPGLNFEEKGSCWMTGWERPTEPVFMVKASSLQEVQLPFIENPECNALYASMVNLTTDKKVYKIEDDMLCAGDIRNPKVICLGDLGSPLVCEVSKIWTQVAVVSWSTRCSPTYLTVFTRLIPYMEWIKKTRRISLLLTREIGRREGRSESVLSWWRSGTHASFSPLLIPLQIMILHWLFAWAS
ncbi:serine protease 27-like isoform X2 [Notamacropus eugenii]|uniref:serine protease 27-like isoform X2 n=1 Tax=Notamacropus eugenii TaxID=9315 RepID=UPI003B676BE9